MKKYSFKIIIGITSILLFFLMPGNGLAQDQATADGEVRIGAMKGPTGMGLVQLMEMDQYEFTLSGTSDEIVAGIVGGNLDVAAVPCNLASVLFNRTQGQVSVAAVNTLGVLYVLETGSTITSIEDLKEKTIYTTGKGTSPEFVLRYVLMENGIDPDTDLSIEFKSEATEIATMFATGQEMIALLPQPFVTTVSVQNPDARIALDMTAEWNKVSPESQLITGCVIVRNDFVEEDEKALGLLFDNYANSVDFVNENPDEASVLIEEYGIIPSAAIAKKAIPYSNITLIQGDEMQQLVNDYLSVLFSANPESVGGMLPDESFYYKK